MRALLTITLIFSFLASDAQMISVIKAGTKKRRLYHEGDFIHLNIGKREVTGHLFYISDTLLLVDDLPVNPDSVTKIHDYSKGNFASRMSAKLVSAGVFYFLLTTINRSGNGDDPVFTDYNAKISAGLALSGILIAKFRKRVFKLDKTSRLTVLNP